MTLPEAIVRAADSIGYGVALASQLAVFPLFGIHVTFADNLGISAYFTIISLIRGFVVRRVFNGWQARTE
jgi:hypothetical protein